MQAVDIGRWREPVIPSLSTSQAQVAWARCRPEHLRTDPPAAGDIVGLRLTAGGPVGPARVLQVRMDRPADTRAGVEIDWNVWRYVLTGYGEGCGPVEISERGDREVRLVDDPWPDVVVQTLDGPLLRLVCREARLPGSPGWLRGGE